MVINMSCFYKFETVTIHVFFRFYFCIVAFPLLVYYLRSDKSNSSLPILQAARGSCDFKVCKDSLKRMSKWQFLRNVHELFLEISGILTTISED